MTKERLEEIKRTEYQIMELSKTDMQADFNYLLNYIEGQAKQVQKLGKDLNKQLEIGYKFECEIHDLADQNKRYREAFEKIKEMLKDVTMDCGMIMNELRIMCEEMEESE